MDGVALFKDLVWGPLVKAALGKLFVAVPFLGWGPVGYIITWVIEKYADELFEAVHTFINVELIAFKNKQLEREYTTAQLKLKLIVDNSGINSKEFKDARKKHQDQIAVVIDMRPSA